MFIIAGLGNPTKQYEGTRHNVGFEVIDRISEKYNIDVDAKKHMPSTLTFRRAAPCPVLRCSLKPFRSTSMQF